MDAKIQNATLNILLGFLAGFIGTAGRTDWLVGGSNLCFRIQTVNGKKKEVIKQGALAVAEQEFSKLMGKTKLHADTIKKNKLLFTIIGVKHEEEA